MRYLAMTRAMANQSLTCVFCSNLIEPGEIFWNLSESLPICRKHISLNTKGMIVKPFSEGSPITYVRTDSVDIRREIIPRLLNDWDTIYSLTPEEFEELVFDSACRYGLRAVSPGAGQQKGWRDRHYLLDSQRVSHAWGGTDKAPENARSEDWSRRRKEFGWRHARPSL